MTIRFLVAAEVELDEAVSFYERQRRGLGSAFLVELFSALERIAEHPEAWQALEGDIRRCRVSRFHYAVICTVEGDDILIIAISHLHRRPGHWRDRLPR